jgi:hypothetical protein
LLLKVGEAGAGLLQPAADLLQASGLDLQEGAQAVLLRAPGGQLLLRPLQTGEGLPELPHRALELADLELQRGLSFAELALHLVQAPLDQGGQLLPQAGEGGLRRRRAGGLGMGSGQGRGQLTDLLPGLLQEGGQLVHPLLKQGDGLFVLPALLLQPEDGLAGLRELHLDLRPHGAPPGRDSGVRRAQFGPLRDETPGDLSGARCGFSLHGFRKRGHGLRLGSP